MLVHPLGLHPARTHRSGRRDDPDRLVDAGKRTARAGCGRGRYRVGCPGGRAPGRGTTLVRHAPGRDGSVCRRTGNARLYSLHSTAFPGGVLGVSPRDGNRS
ncbi:hypothetical protein ACFFX0_08475 [Citricoccus parietis]|uniref:Uncharacterized protein n=1 Tax=Citricoccus parietis TaxID=592307 RepID=A0ABV5FX25_9MICC